MSKKNQQLLSLICLGFLCAQVAANTSPFPYAPLHLQSEVEITSAEGAKPNVLLFIDDSGSMQWVPESNSNPSRYNSGKSRMSITKNVLDTIVSKYQDRMRWGLHTLHNNGQRYIDRTLYGPNMNFPAKYDDPNNWLETKKRISWLAAGGGTPSTESFLQGINKLIDTVDYRCQKNYVIFMSDGDANGRRGWVTNVSNYFTNYSDYTRGIKYNNNLYLDYDDSRNTANLSQFTNLMDKQDLRVRQHGVDLGGVSWDDPEFPLQTVQTYTIGFGAGISNYGRQYLERAASADPHNPGKKLFFSADNEQQLIDSFDRIFTQVNDENAVGDIKAHSVAAPALTSNAIVGLAASATLDTGSWSSQLRFYGFENKAVDTSKWNTPLFPNKRNVLVSVNGEYKLVDQLKLNNAFFGLDGARNNDEWKSALLPWLVRSKSDKTIGEWARATGSKMVYRERSEEARDMGDIVDNPIIAFGPESVVNKKTKYLVTSTNDGMLYLFKDKEGVGSDKHPYELIFNYLPMSMQRESLDNRDTVAKYYKNIAADNYGVDKNDNSHVFLMNGGISVRTTAADKKGNKQTFLVSSMGQAARGMFALNVAGNSLLNGSVVGVEVDSKDLPTTAPLFETGKGVTNQLGYTVSTPQIGRISVNRAKGRNLIKQNVRYATFLANGYKSPSIKESALYVYETLGVDAGTDGNKSLNNRYAVGETIKKIVAPDSSEGLSTPLLLDVDFDGLVDIAYAGSYDGNLYRFDFRGDTPDDWTVTMVYEGDSDQPITSAPAVYRLTDGSNKLTGKYIVAFGTGSDLYQKDLIDRRKQSIYGIYDDVNVIPSQALNRYDLLKQSYKNIKASGKEFRFLSNKKLESKHKGWYIDLDMARDGERVTTSPSMLLNTAVFTTRIYNNEVTESQSGSTSNLDVCKATTKTVKSDAQSWVFAMDITNGGALTDENARIAFKVDGQVVVDKDFDPNDTLMQNKNYYANGQKYSGLSNYTLVQGANFSSRSADGSMRNLGSDDPLGTLSKIPSNGCFSTGENHIVINDTTGGFNVESLHGQRCQRGINRLSWHEI